MATPAQAAISALRLTGALMPDPDTLVMYVYSNSDPEYERNLRFFVANGVRAGDGCDYVIVLQVVRLGGYIRVTRV